jgi:hypothetical protein
MQCTTARFPARRLSRLIALWLTVLIASPFTAPFATCDLNTVTFDVAVDAVGDGGDAATAKMLSDTARPVFGSMPRPLTDGLAALLQDRAPARSLLHSISPLPLRL